MKDRFILIFLLTSLSSFSQESILQYFSFPQPQVFDGRIKYLNDDLEHEVASLDSLRHNSDLLKSLSNIKHSVTFYELNKNGTLNFLSSGVSVKDKTYKVIYDHMLYQGVPYYIKDDSTKKVQAYLGVCVRMTATVTTNKKGLDLSDPLLLSAHRESVNGTLEIQVIGLNSPKISSLIPTTTDLSTSSISAAIQSIGTIRSHLHDSQTIINPQIIGREYTEKELAEHHYVQSSKSKRSIFSGLFKNKRYNRAVF